MLPSDKKDTPLLIRVGRSLLGQATLDESHLVYGVLGDAGPGVMLDVGSCYGDSLRPFERAGWSIHAFEPDPENRSKLSTIHGESANVTVVGKAVSDAPGTLTLYASKESVGVSSLTPFTPGHKPKTTVEVITLKDYMVGADLRKVDFMKIDVEGFEREVLGGYNWSVRPRMLVVEFEDSKTVPRGYSWRDLAEELVSRDYQVLVSEWFPLVRYGAGHKWRRFRTYPTELADPRAWGNLIAVDSRRDDFRRLWKAAAIEGRRYQLRTAVERLRGRGRGDGP